jgi:hypothetical protein
VSGRNGNSQKGDYLSETRARYALMASEAMLRIGRSLSVKPTLAHQ